MLTISKFCLEGKSAIFPLLRVQVYGDYEAAMSLTKYSFVVSVMTHKIESRNA